MANQSATSRMRALAGRLAAIENSVRIETKRPRPDLTRIQRLKRARLRLKDEIQGLRRLGRTARR
ncbi:MAG: YdcH family protein [Pseudomonadota bacterium]